MSRVIVVDASVARRAGAGMHSDSVNCAKALEALFSSSHSIAMSQDLMDEWRRHKKPVAMGFLQRMFSARRVVRNSPPPNSSLRRCLERSTRVVKHQKCLKKDAHLVELALATDKRVLSVDELARTLLQSASVKCTVVAAIYWANPDTDAARCCAWIAAGVKATAALKLG